MSEGLLSGVLPFIFSQGDRLKRNINGWINDPAAKAEQTAGILYDTLNEQTRLQNQAFGDPKDPLKITDQRAFEAATNGILNGVMGFAPAGITKLVGPQSQALETARKNAVKMLGLPENNTPMDRANALGFTTPAYRGTTADEIAGKPRTFVSENPDVANQYAGYLSQFADDPKMLEAMMKLTPNGNVMPLLVKDAAAARARTNQPDYEMILDANQARSRFAAFDPARVKDSNLLAGMLPLGALSGVSTVPPEFFTAPKKEKKKEPKK